MTSHSQSPTEYICSHLKAPFLVVWIKGKPEGYGTPPTLGHCSHTMEVMFTI